MTFFGCVVGRGYTPLVGSHAIDTRNRSAVVQAWSVEQTSAYSYKKKTYSLRNQVFLWGCGGVVCGTSVVLVEPAASRVFEKEVMLWSKF